MRGRNQYGSDGKNSLPCALFDALYASCCPVAMCRCGVVQDVSLEWQLETLQWQWWDRAAQQQSPAPCQITRKIILGRSVIEMASFWKAKLLSLHKSPKDFFQAGITAVTAALGRHSEAGPAKTQVGPPGHHRLLSLKGLVVPKCKWFRVCAQQAGLCAPSGRWFTLHFQTTGLPQL